MFFPLLLYRWRIFRERLRLKKQLRSLELEEIEEFSTSHHNSLSAEERLEKKKELLNKRILLEHAQVDLWEEMMLPEHDSFTEYLFAVTQFGYVACFSVVLPITPLIVLFNHLMNMRLDAFKLCRGRRRPLAVQTGGIGVWNHVLHIVTVIAILTNCALMALTTSQLSWLATKIGKLGVFALSIGIEHFLLLVKYIMQLSVSRLPKSIENEMRKKNYEQERKRYRSLRMKKRSKSSYGTQNLANGDTNNDTDKSGDTLVRSPCPPIQEASTDISSIAPEPYVKLDKSQVLGSSKRGLVNVRALAQHNPQTEKPLPSPKEVYTGNTRRNQYTKDVSKRGENVDPNFDEAIKKLPSGNSNLLFKSQPKALYGSAESIDSSQNTRSTVRKRLPNPALQIDSNSTIATNSSKSWRPSSGNVFSPDSSISTVQGLPTPCQLDLESPESMYSVENAFQFPATNYYQHASAPPMSPAAGNIDLTDDSNAKAKWAVYHSLQYNKSAQKELRQKKSR